MSKKLFGFLVERTVTSLMTFLTSNAQATRSYPAVYNPLVALRPVYFFLFAAERRKVDDQHHSSEFLKLFTCISASGAHQYPVKKAAQLSLATLTSAPGSECKVH